MENTDNILNEALGYINKEEFEQAKSLLQKYLVSDPKNIEALKNLGLCEINLDNPLAAIDAFKQVVENNKDDATSLFYIASCKVRTGEKEEAINYFKEVLKLRPDFLEAYKNIAMIFIEFMQPDNAIDIMLKVLENPNIEIDYSVYYILSTSYMLKKDYENSCKYLEKALELNPNHIAIANSLAVSYMNLGKYNEAKELLLKTYKIDNQNSLTAYNLGIYYQTIKDYKNALNYFQISYNIEPSISMLTSLASCALNANEYSLAATLYQNLVIKSMG